VRRLVKPVDSGSQFASSLALRTSETLPNLNGWQANYGLAPRFCELRDRDRGVSLELVDICLVMLLSVCALAIDLASLDVARNKAPGLSVRIYLTS
jgi:hypothetical protein